MIINILIIAVQSSCRRPLLLIIEKFDIFSDKSSCKFNILPSHSKRIWYRFLFLRMDAASRFNTSWREHETWTASDCWEIPVVLYTRCGVQGWWLSQTAQQFWIYILAKLFFFSANNCVNRPAYHFAILNVESLDWYETHPPNGLTRLQVVKLRRERPRIILIYMFLYIKTFQFFLPKLLNYFPRLLSY